MAEKNDFTIDELAAAVDRIERKLDLYLYRTVDHLRERYDFDCPKLLDCPLAGKSCWMCGR